MIRTILAIAIAASLAGCTAHNSQVGKQVLVQKCPAIKPALPRPEWPSARPKTLPELQHSWLKGRAAFQDISDIVDVWEKSWKACAT